MIRLRAEWVAPVTAPPLRDGGVVVDRGRIVAVGPTGDLAARYPGARERDLGGGLLTAGFVDTHCHVEWSLGAGGAPCDGDFAGWLAAMIRRGAAMTPDDFLAAARLGVASALLAGTTLLLDAGPTGAGARACAELGARAHVHLEIFGRLDGDEATAAAAAMVPRVRALDGPRVRGGVSPHAPYTVGPGLWRALAAEPGLAERPWMTHVAESAQELAAIAGAGGPLAELFHGRGSMPGIWSGEGSVVARLAEGGALVPGLVAAHCVHCDAADLALLARHGAGVAHCPVSNAHLGVGSHDLAATLASGVAVGLGSDSPATGGGYDVRAQARACALTEPDRLLRLATLDGARAAGRHGELGSLEPGKLADLVVIDVPAASADPIAAIFDDGAAVVATMVDGAPVVDGGRLVRGDLDRIRRAARPVAARTGA